MHMKTCLVSKRFDDDEELKTSVVGWLQSQTAEFYVSKLVKRIYNNTVERLFQQIESFTWEDMPHRNPETGELTMAGFIPQMNKFVKRFALLMYAVHIIVRCARVYYGKLMYDTLYPFDTSVHPVVEIVLLTQITVHFTAECRPNNHSVECAPCIMAVDLNIKRQRICLSWSQATKGNIEGGEFDSVLWIEFGLAQWSERLVFSMFRLSLYIIGAPYAYVTFVTVACTQLQKVKESLLKMKAISESEQSEDGRCNKEKEELRMQEEFNDIVRLHQQVISYINTLEDMMCLLLGGILFFILALQCTAAFAAVMSLESKNDLSRAIYLYLIVTFTGVIYCGFGTMLSQETLYHHETTQIYSQHAHRRLSLTTDSTRLPGASAIERIPNLTGEQSDGITVFRIPPMTSLMLHRCRTGAINLQRWWKSLSAAIRNLIASCIGRELADE
ncbi:hypothetical protein ANN_17341 [Periplaneta americana]|uniref:Odorant receptor n=1 Tax=Periplaneta americana TaxID=6978 RepID=A0ABQ8STY4_PERAM|nr:hypothetical protein ANN_17341 [Periplaneta americana]